MNNLALFVCGLVITLLSGMGVLVYCVMLGYEKHGFSKKQSKFNIVAGAGKTKSPAA